MISGICPAEVYNVRNAQAQKIMCFCSIPFAVNKKEEDVFVKSGNDFNEYGLSIQKCKTKEDIKIFNKTVKEEFNLSYAEKPARQIAFLEACFQKVNRSQYLVKNKNGEITGAIHLYENKPDKKHYRQLYIAEMCVPQKFHKTKTSYGTLKTIFGLVKDKSKDYDCLTLNVDSSNKSLVRMYKKLGFYTAGYDSGYYFMINPLNSKVKTDYPELDVSKPKSIKPQINKNSKKEN